MFDVYRIVSLEFVLGRAAGCVVSSWNLIVITTLQCDGVFIEFVFHIIC